jgi:hypothetical protein
MSTRCSLFQSQRFRMHSQFFVPTNYKEWKVRGPLGWDVAKVAEVGEGAEVVTGEADRARTHDLEWFGRMDRNQKQQNM